MHRLRKVVRSRWLKRFGAASYARVELASPPLREDFLGSESLPWKLADRRLRGAEEAAKDLAVGRFRFLGQTVEFPESIDWRLSNQTGNVDALWRFHLHYHEYLLDLLAVAESGEQSWEIVVDWIELNQPSEGRVFSDAWHPFCISRRLPVWVLLWTADPPPVEQRESILASMAAQANFLIDHLETDLGGNHLLENLRALGMAGSFLAGADADRWLSIVRQTLPRELAIQITEQGEHFERSPMYHCHMLEVMLDLRDATAQVDPAISSCAAQAAVRMGQFLSRVLHPDNDIPLLGDSWLDDAPSPPNLLARIESPSSVEASKENETTSSAGGYWTFRDRDNFLLLDVAPACPDHLPAHAHADLLGIEASVAGQRLFVDSGVSTYAASPMRQYCRGTAAHNVLQVDRTDQFDVWSRFRMGYRGWPQQLEQGQNDGFQWARATHNAYRRTGVPVVGRWLACRANGPWLCVDWAEGEGEHELTERLHIHPQVEVTQTADLVFKLQIEGQQLELQVLGAAVASIEEGWYCPTFGERQPGQVITWGGRFELPAALGWALKWPGQQGSVTLSEGEPIVVWDENDAQLEWRPPS